MGYRPRKTREKRQPDPRLAHLPKLAYTVREAAHVLSVSEGTIRQLIHVGKLRAIPKGSGSARVHFFIPLASIQALLDQA